MSNDNNRFYQLMGPFLSRREIVSDLGAPTWDDDNKTWCLAIDNGSVIGFVAFINKGHYHELCSDWVSPDQRRRGVYRALFGRRLEEIGDSDMRATVTNESLSVFLASGFKVVGKRGRYTRVAK